MNGGGSAGGNALADTVQILGIRVNRIDVAGVHEVIRNIVKSSGKEMILNVNIHCMNLACELPWLKALLNKSHTVFCDGDGVRWGMRLLGQEPPVKITYDRWMWQLAEMCEKEKISLFFLGAKPGVAESAATRLKARFSALKIAGTHHGYFQKNGPEAEEVIRSINKVRPDILVLGFGMPVQELLLRDYAERIDTHVFLTGGAVFDYVSGRAVRAPQWMIQLHLEWFFRFLREPRRLFKRYFIGNFVFFLRVLRYGADGPKPSVPGHQDRR